MKIIETADYETIARLNESVQTLHSALYPEHFKAYNFEAVRDFFKEIMNKPNFIFLLVEEDNQYIGYSWIELKSYSENVFKKARQSVYVHQISIAGTQRRKGYGSKLMDKICEIAKENGIYRLELDYYSGNSIADDFYQKNGFVKSQEFVYKQLFQANGNL